MIHLINVSKVLTKRSGGKIPILKPTTLSIPTNARIGIWDKKGKVTSVLLELLAGALPLTTGRIVRNARISPPISLRGIVQNNLSGLDNIAFMARIYGENVDNTIDLVDKFSELGSDLEKPVKLYNADMRARLGLSISFSIPFDCYLAEAAVLSGPKWFKDKCQVFLDGAGAQTGLLLVGPRVRELKKHCDAFLVYRNHELNPLTSWEEAE